MTRWQIGDIALIRSLDDIEPQYRGRECTVLSNLVHVPGLKGARYRIDLQGFENGYRVYASPHVLKPLPSPELPGSWAACVWRPKNIHQEYP